MRLAWRLLSLLVVVAVLVATGTAISTGWILVRSEPQRTGTLHAAGLTDSVTVRRDANGFTNIYASNAHDLFLAQGYVHASERMWQMEILRRAGEGRLAELFGKSQLDTDRLVRTLGWRQAAERDVAAASPAVRDALAAYAAGVNAWLAENPSLSLPFVLAGLLRLQGGLDGYRPDPWTPVDSAVFAKTEGWLLAGNFSSEIFRFLLAQKVDEQAVTELYAPPNPEFPTITGAGATTGSVVTGAPAAPLPADALASADPAALDHLLSVSEGVATALGASPAGGLSGPDGAGSNEWAVSPARSTSGFALLANDPHLGVTMPSVFYVVGLHCRPLNDACPYDVSGVSFPSVPGVILGHDRHVAWGATNSGADVQDLFLEKLDPADPTHYEYLGRSLPFETRDETIAVRGASDVTITVRSTVHGPVIDDVVKPLAPASEKGGGLGKPGYVFALQWPAIATTDHSLDAFLQLDRATDQASFRAALSLFGGPPQNFLYADDAGHIAYQLAGEIPVRKGGQDGSVPVAGWDGAGDWTGYVPFDGLPRSLDPKGGAIATANNDPTGPGYPYFLGREWDTGFRAERITQLLAARTRFSLDDFRAMQLDDRLLRADPLIAVIGGANPKTADGTLVRQRISQWDGTTPLDSLGAAAGEVVAYRLLRDVFDDELGAGTAKDDIARRWAGDPQARDVMARLLAEVKAGTPPERWWDDVHTTVVESPADIIARACDEAGAELRAALGDPSAWTWGNLHRMVYREPTLGSAGLAPLDLIFDRGPVGVAGSGDAVNDTVWVPSVAYPDPYDPNYKPADLFGVFETRIAPAYRGVYDTGDWDAAMIVSTTGQSEHPLDGHFADLIGPWNSGVLLPFPFSDSAVAKATTDTMTLAP